jgi:hypothetical protein
MENPVVDNVIRTNKHKKMQGSKVAQDILNYRQATITAQHDVPEWFRCSAIKCIMVVVTFPRTQSGTDYDRLIFEAAFSIRMRFPDTAILDYVITCDAQNIASTQAVMRFCVIDKTEEYTERRKLCTAATISFLGCSMIKDKNVRRLVAAQIWATRCSDIWPASPAPIIPTKELLVFGICE